MRARGVIVFYMERRCRYQVQTLSGLEWGHYAANPELSRAKLYLSDARKTGYRARLVDTFTGKVIK